MILNTRTIRCFAALVAIATIFVPRGSSAEAWPTTRQWTAAEECNFSKWVATIGSRQWQNANKMLRSPENQLRDRRDDTMNYYADCADLPYLLRGYYAWKRGLPFVVDFVEGTRYNPKPNRHSGKVDNQTFDGEAPSFFASLPHMVSSGNFRMAPNDPRSFAYPIKIHPEQLRPGAIFYNPNGHVAVVVEVRSNGTIFTLDAHPDGTITRVRFGPKAAWQSDSHQGGFRWYRPVVSIDDNPSHGAKFITDNRKIPGFSLEQFSFEDRFHLEVRLALNVGEIDPGKALAEYIREDCYREVLDRVQSVDLGWQAARTQRIPIPPNLYFSKGLWENYSTPGRDIRLRSSFLHLPNLAKQYLELYRKSPDRFPKIQSEAHLLRSLIETKELLFHNLHFSYTRSDETKRKLSLHDIENQLFDLSFDPNHVPELRWGEAPLTNRPKYGEGSDHTWGYQKQRYWRNRLTPRSGTMRWDDLDNPRTPAPHDLTKLLEELRSEAK